MNYYRFNSCEIKSIQSYNEYCKIVQNCQNVGVRGVARLDPDGHHSLNVEVKLKNIHNKLLRVKFL